jgi:hypothetical protein
MAPCDTRAFLTKSLIAIHCSISSHRVIEFPTPDPEAAWSGMFEPNSDASEFPLHPARKLPELEVAQGVRNGDMDPSGHEPHGIGR